jgi:hypothetical protein
MNLSEAKAIREIDISTPEALQHFLKNNELVGSFYRGYNGEVVRCHPDLESFLGYDQGGTNSSNAFKIEVLNDDLRMLRVTFDRFNDEVASVAYLIVK